MKRFVISLTTILILILTLSSCGKKCGECPDGMHLSVDDPKESSCICCPVGQDYDSTLGYCN